jgi:predicted hydrolase (HD superfamily)
VKGAEELGLTIEEHMATCIEAMCGIADRLGLERK